MSGGFNVKCTPVNAWREKGYRDGEAGRPRRGPLGLDEMAAYVEGYRHGAKAAERSRSDRA